MPAGISGELYPNLTTRDQWKRLVAVGMEKETWTLALLWDWVHEHYEDVYVFDSTGSAEDLIEELVKIIEREESKKASTT